MALLFASTVTPGTAPPLLSLTRPPMEPVVCANAEAETKRRRAMRERRIKNLLSRLDEAETISRSTRRCVEDLANAPQTRFDLRGRDCAGAEPEPAILFLPAE